MAIDKVSLRVQSATVPADELDALLGRTPTRVTARGAPVSSRDPSGATHPVTTWVLDAAGASGDEIGGYFGALEGVLGRLAEMGVRPDLDCDLVVMLTGRPLGWLLEIAPSDLRRLQQANCGLMLDVYSED